MRVRAPIHLSDNSDDDEEAADSSYRGSFSRPARSPLSNSHSHSPLAAERAAAVYTAEAVSPASTLSWTSPRSAPSLTPPHSHSPPRAPLLAAQLDASEVQRRLTLDVAALRIERRQQRSAQAAAAAATRPAHQRSTHTTSLAQSGVGDAAGDGVVSECRSDLRELTALADQAEHWLAVMRAANTNTTRAQQLERRSIAVEDET